MSTALTIVSIWLAFSVPFSLMAGASIRFGMGE